jgi:hypothetical protein
MWQDEAVPITAPKYSQSADSQHTIFTSKKNPINLDKWENISSKQWLHMYAVIMTLANPDGIA